MGHASPSLRARSSARTPRAEKRLAGRGRWPIDVASIHRGDCCRHGLSTKIRYPSPQIFLLTLVQVGGTGRFIMSTISHPADAVETSLLARSRSLVPSFARIA